MIIVKFDGKLSGIVALNLCNFSSTCQTSVYQFHHQHSQRCIHWPDCAKYFVSEEATMCITSEWFKFDPFPSFFSFSAHGRRLDFNSIATISSDAFTGLKALRIM